MNGERNGTKIANLILTGEQKENKKKQCAVCVRLCSILKMNIYKCTHTLLHLHTRDIPYTTQYTNDM